MKKNKKQNRPQAGVLNPLLLILDIFSQWTSHHWSFEEVPFNQNPAAAYLLKMTFALRFHFWKDLEPGESNEGQSVQLLLFLCFCYHAASLHAKDTDNIYHGCTPTGGSYLRGCCGFHCEVYNKEKGKNKIQIFQTDKFVCHLMLRFIYMTTYYSAC